MPNVLVVDDSEVDRVLIGGLLGEDVDLAVSFATSGTEALAHLARQQPDLVVTDMHMPEITGLELVSAARERYPQLPLVLITGQGSEEIAMRALQAGAASYVPKRMLADNLLDTVRRVLSISTRERSQFRLFERRSGQQSSWVLENDSYLVSSLVAYLQEETQKMGVCDESGKMRIGIALEEALVNAMYHGNLELKSELKEGDGELWRKTAEDRRTKSPYRERRLFVTAEITRNQARYTIRDEGLGFDPTAVADCTDPANLEKCSGRGLLLMRTFMDDVSHGEGGRQVTLVKKRK